MTTERSDAATAQEPGNWKLRGKVAPEPVEGRGPADTLTLDFWPSEL